MDNVPWHRAAREALEKDQAERGNLVPLKPEPEPTELTAEKPMVRLEELEAQLNDPLYGIAIALRKLTWEEMNELCQGAHCQPEKVIAWAKIKMGEELVDVTPPKPNRRV